MSNVIRVKGKHFRSLAWKTLKVEKIYNFYRQGWLENEKKFRTFVYFPSRIADEVIISWDERAKVVEGETMELREKFWDSDLKKFIYKKVNEPINLAFYKLFKKVIDLEFTCASDFKHETWSKELKKNVPDIVSAWEVFSIDAISSSRIKTMLDDFDLADDVPLIDWKDKLGNPAKVREYDWEESRRKRLEGVYFTFKVTWEGIDSRYRFKEAAPFVVESAIEKDFKIDTPISIEDIPF